MIDSFESYSFKLEIFANCENSTILSDGAVMFLNHLALFKCLKDSPEDMLVQFNNEIEKIFAGLRQVVSSQQCNVGKLTNHINDDIECLEHALKHLLKEFVENGLDNLSHCKKSDFGPVMWRLQNFANTMASIANTILNDTCLFNDEVIHSMTILSIVFNHCLTVALGSTTTMAALINTKTKRVPRLLNTCLHSMDSALILLTNSIRSVAIDCESTLRELLKTVAKVSDWLSEDFEKEDGRTKGSVLTPKRIAQYLSNGFSKGLHDDFH